MLASEVIAAVLQWAEALPMGQPFIVDKAIQVEYRCSNSQASWKGSKGGSKGVPAADIYAMSLKPQRGKGNITVFLGTGLVMVNASVKTGMQQKLLGYISDWTVGAW